MASGDAARRYVTEKDRRLARWNYVGSAVGALLVVMSTFKLWLLESGPLDVVLHLGWTGLMVWFLIQAERHRRGTGKEHR
jgi:hypothetical protein